jgi:glutamyl-tRNA reductase
MITILKEKLGTIIGVKCLVIGNGQMGKLVANTLLANGAEVCMTLRRHIHGRDEQESIMPEGCTMVSYDDRINQVTKNKVIVSATLSPHYTLKYEDLEEKSASMQYIFDLAVPRDIDPEIRKLNGVELYDIDTINGGSTEEQNAEQLEMAMAILSEYQQELKKWFEFRKHVNKIQGITELVSEDAIERFTNGTEKLDRMYDVTDVNDVVEKSVKKAISKIMYGLKETLPQEIWAECVDGLHKAAAKETLKH